MADVKPTETPVAEPAVEKKIEEIPAVVAPATEEAAPAPAVETTEAAAETTEAPAATEAAKEPVEEAKPVEDGHLSHKPEGANFPKNLIHSKKFFWFGSEPVDVKATPSFKADKVADVAHHVTAWAAETGKGLLFFGEKDKSAPQGAIQLAEASEPATDGANKFHFVSKGHKHSFKAATTAERDAWVAQIKAKIAEAKELAATVTESETYKKTLEALKPTPAKKEEKAPAAAEPAAETAAEPATTEAVAAAPAVEEPAAEAPKEEAKEEAKKEEEPKRRSASRKRASIFGSVFGKKEEKKVEAAPEAEAPAPAAEATPAASETLAVTEAPAAAETTETPAPAAEPVAETKAEEKKEEVAEAPKPAKRASLFGNLSFGKKKVASPEPTPTTEEAPATTEAVAETAPVIPAVETTEPLSAEVSSPATVPTETTEVAPATNGETKKEVKSDKRKSSLPFVGAFLNPKAKEAKATSDDETEKPKPTSPFSKLRATIKGKKAEKTEKVEEKTEEKSEKTEDTPAPAAEAETSAATEAPAKVETDAAAPEEPAKPVTATPVVTAAA